MIARLHNHDMTTFYAGVLARFRYSFVSLDEHIRQDAQAGLHLIVGIVIDADLTIRFHNRQTHLPQLLNAAQTEFHKELKLRHIGALHILEAS